MTGSYNNFFRTFDRNIKKDFTWEASRDVAKPKSVLKPRKVKYNSYFVQKILELFNALNDLEMFLMI